jgi:hypothetical protein
MKTLKGGRNMAKVKLEGAVRMEIEVKYGLNEDLELKIHEVPIEVDGKVYKVLVGEGDISHVPEKTLKFIGDRIEGILRKQKDVIGVSGIGDFFRYGYIGWIQEDGGYVKALRRSELGKLMLDAYKHRKTEAVEEVLSRNLFFLSESGMREFVGLKKMKDAREKIGMKDSKYKYV